MSAVLALRHCVIDLQRYQVRRGGEVVPLTGREVELLAYLIECAGEVVTRKQIHERVWGYHPDSKSHAVAVAIRRLRAKIEPDPANPTLLLTVPRVGWKLVPPRTADVRAPSRLPVRYDSFVGRSDELARAEAALDKTLLVSLVGPGGAGKTRLAEEIGRRAVRRSGRSVLFCPLASATTPDDVVARVAEALDLDSTESDRVLAALAARGPLLLVLDNLEQIPDVAVLIDGWLEALPQACILATSRIALGLPLETTVAVGPLDADSALRLFTDRALAARPDFSLDATNRALVEALVERLDRLSLALELAAARLAVLDLDRLTMELERRFRLLADPSGTREERHSALSTAIAWSVSLLSDDEQSAFAQLGVFRGGFTLEQAEAVLSVDGWAVDVLQNLVRASLVTRDGGRFGLLESVREYAEQQLDPPEPTWGRHWVCFSEMGTEAFQERLEGPEGPTLRLQVRDALDNLRVATDRAIAAGATTAAVRCGRAATEQLKVSGALAPAAALLGRVHTLDLDREDRAVIARIRADIAAQSGQREQAFAWLEEARDCAEGLELGRSQAALGDLYREGGKPVEARLWLDRAIATLQSQEGDRDLATTLGRRAILNREEGRVSEALSQFERAIASHVDQGTVRQEGMAHMHRGITLRELGRHSEAGTAYAEALRCFRAAADRRYEAITIQELGVLARNEGRIDEALDYLDQALERHRAMGLRRLEAMCVGNKANLLTDQERYEEALVLYAEGTEIKRQIGDLRFIWVTEGNAGEVLTRLGRYEEAIDKLRSAITGASEARFKQAEGSFEVGLGEALSHLGRTEEAWTHLKRGEQLLRETEHQQEIAKAIARQGQVALRSGDASLAEDRLDAARSVLKEADLGPKTPAAVVVSHLEQALLALGRLASESPVAGNPALRATRS